MNESFWGARIIGYPALPAAWREFGTLGSDFDFCEIGGDVRNLLVHYSTPFYNPHYGPLV